MRQEHVQDRYEPVKNTHRTIVLYAARADYRQIPVRREGPKYEHNHNATENRDGYLPDPDRCFDMPVDRLKQERIEDFALSRIQANGGHFFR